MARNPSTMFVDDERCPLFGVMRYLVVKMPMTMAAKHAPAIAEPD